jgi:hypothetical protein
MLERANKTGDTIIDLARATGASVTAAQKHGARGLASSQPRLVRT